MKDVILLAGHGGLLKNGKYPTKGKLIKIKRVWIKIKELLSKDKHGVVDYSTYYEGVDNRKAVRSLEIMLADKGREVENLIGNSPINVSLKDRIKTANLYDKETSILLDIHSNAGQSSARGTVVFYYKWSKESKRLAQCISDKMESMTDIPSRGIKPTLSFYVTRKSNMPCALVERGFFTNKEDLELMITQRDRQAKAIADGVRAFEKGGS